MRHSGMGGWLLRILRCRFDLAFMVAERHSECLFQNVTGPYNAGARLGKPAGNPGAAFPGGGGVAAAPVQGAKFLQFAGPGLWKVAEQRSDKPARGRNKNKLISYGKKFVSTPDS